MSLCFSTRFLHRTRAFSFDPKILSQPPHAVIYIWNRAPSTKSTEIVYVTGLIALDHRLWTGGPKSFSSPDPPSATMAPLLNGYANGNRHLSTEPPTADVRFSDIPSSLEIQVAGGDAEEAVEISLKELEDDPTEICTVLENENAEKRVWMVVALAYARQRKVDHAIDILHKGMASLSRGNPKEKLALLSLLCWMSLGQSRNAPRVLPESQQSSEIKTKDSWLTSATGILNEASRINPAFPPLYLARGVLYLLRASLQPPSKPVAPGSVDHSERMESLRQALKCFEDAARVSSGRNMMAVIGTARAQFSMGKYADALKGYQEVLLKMPHLHDPDPRIGIGCCLWQLEFKEEARESWERALEIVSRTTRAGRSIIILTRR